MSSNRCDQAPTALRRIEVHVEQGEDGWFRWVLIEQPAPGSEWADFSSAELRFKTCNQAMAAGLLVLQGLMELWISGRASLTRLRLPEETTSRRASVGIPPAAVRAEFASREVPVLRKAART